MTKVTVSPGNCGFAVTITAEKEKDQKIKVSLDTECEMVMKMMDDISILDKRTLFSSHLSNPVYRSASKCLKHVACPVALAILKTVEVEAGLALPADINISFSKD